MKTILLSLLLLPCLGYAAPRIATSDWSIAETLTALGAPPVAAGDKVSYQKWVAYPQLPEATLDMGVRMQPNIEYLHRIHPDFFIQSAFYMGNAATLRRIAPVHQVDLANESGITWQNTLSATRQIAQLAQQPAAAERLIHATEAQFQQQKAQLRAYAHRPFAVVQFINARQLRIYGHSSLFHVVLQQLGLHNAWTGASNQWGFANISLGELAKLPENTMLIIVKPHPADVGRTLQHSTLWQRLPMSRVENHRVIAPVWAYGGLAAMQRFGHEFSQAMHHSKPVAW